MAENVENLMLEHLRAIRASQDRIEFEVKEVKTRITHLEQTVLGGSRATPAGPQPASQMHVLKLCPRLFFVWLTDANQPKKTANGQPPLIGDWLVRFGGIIGT